MAGRSYLYEIQGVTKELEDAFFDPFGMEFDDPDGHEVDGCLMSPDQGWTLIHIQFVDDVFPPEEDLIAYGEKFAREHGIKVFSRFASKPEGWVSTPDSWKRPR